MNFLALDTSSNACSVALQFDHQILHRHIVEPRAHTRVLLPTIDALLQEGGIDLRDLDAIVLGNGPGSFIGMRIGASVAQGLCFGAGLKIVPVSSLAVIAAEVFTSSDIDRVAVAQDARMDECYVGQYERDVADLPRLVGNEEIVAIGLKLPFDGRFYVAGAAWNKYPQLVTENEQHIVSQLDVSVPDARFLLHIGAQEYQRSGGIAAHDLVPAYLRAKVANSPGVPG